GGAGNQGRVAESRSRRKSDRRAVRPRPVSGRVRKPSDTPLEALLARLMPEFRRRGPKRRNPRSPAGLRVMLGARRAQLRPRERGPPPARAGRRRLWPRLPLPSTRTPSSRSGASARPIASRSFGFSDGIEIGSTGTSAFGYSHFKGTHAPWSSPRSGARATSIVPDSSFSTRSPSAGAPGASYF